MTADQTAEAPADQPTKETPCESDDSRDEDFVPRKPGAEIGPARPPQRLWRYLCTPVVEVCVGPSRRSFWLHRGLLRRHSLFFRGMLRSNGFRESRDHVVRLPGDEVASFAVFAEWLYLGQECDSGDVWIDGHGKDLNDAESSEFLGASLPPASQGKKLAAKKADKDDDEGYEGEGEGGGEDEDEDYENERARLPKKDKQEGPSANGTADVDEDEDRWETGSTVSSRGRHDYYDFSLQFSCYVLADKILAPGFKRHILDEIRMHGEFYQPSSLTPAMIQYVYRNTALRDDPLRKFCIYLKCVKEPIQETLADPEFQALMEQGGPLVKDVMEVCRKLSLKGPGWQKEAFEGLNLEDGYVPAGPSVTWEYRKAVLEGYLESISKDPEERTDPPAS